MGNTETHNNLKEISRLQTQMENVNEKIDDLKEEQAKIQQEQKEGFEKVLTKIDNLDKRYVKREIYKKDMENIQCYLEDNKDNKKWLWRTVGAVVISSAIAALVSAITRGVGI